MNQKLRTEHDIKVPRNVVYNVMTEVDPDGLKKRSVINKKKKRDQVFKSDGPDFVWSLDGHDKLCGYQNWTFPLGVYGCIDTFSRKMLFIFVAQSNSNPKLIGRRYFDYLYSMKILPTYLRIDKGTETGKMATIHAYLAGQTGDMEDPTDAVIYGPSTTNKIEWWLDLHERLEKFFKSQLQCLLNGKDYNSHNDLHRQLLAYVYIPIVQRECDIFVRNWNSHRIRNQGKPGIPSGIPDHLYSFPENYGGVQMGTSLNSEQLKDVAEVSFVLETSVGLQLDENVRKTCIEVMPNPENIDSDKAMEAYRFLLTKF